VGLFYNAPEPTWGPNYTEENNQRTFIKAYELKKVTC